MNNTLLNEITYEDIRQFRNETKKLLGNLDYNYTISYKTEVFDGFYQNIKNFMTRGLQDIGNWFQQIKEKTPDPIPHFYKFDDVQKEINKFCSNSDNYLKYATVEVPYMSGCELPFNVFVEELCKITNRHGIIVMTSLDELDNYVSGLIADSNVRLAHKPEPITKTMAEARDFSKDVTALNIKLINPKLYRDTILFEKLTPNLKELEVSGDRLKSLGKIILKDNLEKTLYRSKSVSDKVKALVNEILIKENTQCSKACLDNLKTKVEITANAVTALSTYYYFVSEAVKIYKVLPKVLK